MGQQGSSSRDTVICCTTRENDEDRAVDSIGCQRSQAKDDGSSSMKRPRIAAEAGRNGLSDGGTGGTCATPQRAREESCGNPCDPTDGGRLIDIACVQDRSADTAAGRRALFGDKSLKPKLQRHRALEAEVEALTQIRTQISKRLPAEAGMPVAVPVALEAGSNRVPEAELVRRLRLHEEALAGVPEKFVTQACVRVLGDVGGGLAERSVELVGMKEQYAEILTTVDTLVQERIDELHAEISKLDSEVEEIEDLIAFCFDKMDEEATGSISGSRFVAFVCTEESQELVQPDTECADTVYVSPEDAESLFIQMSHGHGEITFEQFKDEITAGCLQLLQANIGVRRRMQKQYRDTWF